MAELFGSCKLSVLVFKILSYSPSLLPVITKGCKLLLKVLDHVLNKLFLRINACKADVMGLKYFLVVFIFHTLIMAGL